MKIDIEPNAEGEEDHLYVVITDDGRLYEGRLWYNNPLTPSERRERLGRLMTALESDED